MSAATGHLPSRPLRRLPERLCVVAPAPASYSETFIRNHLEHLPFAMHVVSGEPLPERLADGRRIRPAVRRLWDRAARHLGPLTLEEQLRRAFVRFLRGRGIGIVLAEYGPTGAAVAPACEAAGVPLVVHFHGYDAYRTSTLEENRSGYRRAYATAAAIVVVSRDMERQLVTLGAPPSKLRRIIYGVDPTHFQGSDPAAAPVRFVAVGRFVEKKAPQLTLEAFARVAASRPDARLVLIGDGPLRLRCVGLARTLGIADKVDFPGVLPPAAVAAVLRSARCFVQHSVRAADGDCEGTPVALIEAAASGLPAVATRHGGIPDVVEHGRQGLLVGEGDVGAMAAAMLRVAREPDLAAALGAAARRRVLQELTLERSIGTLADVLLDAAASARPGAAHVAG